MRKLFLLLLCVPLLVACGDSGEDDITSAEKTITYKFNSNAAPTGANNLIGVQIYQGTKTSSKDLIMYSPYAYGLFDDFSKIKLDLPRGHEYKIISTVIVDGKTKVAKDDNGYLKPFSIKDNGIPLTNSFVLNSNDAMLLLNKSTTTVVDNSNLKSSLYGIDSEVPQLDRYYGESVDYDGNSNENPIVDMDRYVFGLKFTVAFVGDNIGDDNCILLAVEGASDTIKIKAKDEEKIKELMYTYPQFSKEDTPKSVDIRAFFKYEDDSKLWEFVSLGIGELARNSLKTLTITVNHSYYITSFDYEWGGVNNYYGEGD